MTNKLKFSNYFLSTFLQIIASTFPSLVRVQLFFGDGQAGEGELEGGGVAPDQLRGDVEEDAVVVLVRVVERARRHVEEVLRGQPEGVHSRGHQVCADLLQLDRRRGRTVVALAHTVHVNHMPVVHNTSVTVSPVMPDV